MPPTAEIDPAQRNANAQPNIGLGLGDRLLAGGVVGSAVLLAYAGTAAASETSNPNVEKATLASTNNALTRTIDSFPEPISAGEQLVPGREGLVRADATMSASLKQLCIKAIRTSPKFISAAVTRPKDGARVTIPGKGTHKVETRGYGFKLNYSRVMEEFDQAGCSDQFTLGMSFEPQIIDARRPGKYVSANPDYDRPANSYSYNANLFGPEYFNYISRPLIRENPNENILQTPRGEIEPPPRPKRARIVVKQALLKETGVPYKNPTVFQRVVMRKPMKVRKPYR